MVTTLAKLLNKTLVATSKLLQTVLMERMQMRDKVLSVVAATALLASVGVANAQGPVTLTDGQLDKATAGAAATSTNQVGFLLGTSTNELNNLLTLSYFTIGLLNGAFLPTVPVTP
jgi:hypothetical protein